MESRKLRKIIRESVRTILENYKKFELDEDFSAVSEKLKNMSVQLDGFIAEFKRFTKAIQEFAQSNGLVLDDSYGPYSYDIQDAVNNTVVSFEYFFKLQGTDESDDMYERLSDELDEWLNDIGFRFGDISVSCSDGVSVRYDFSFFE